MFHFSHPSFLWALSGLIVPVAIHLLSRKEGKIIRMGTLRHLQETSTRQFRGIRLNELWLLLLRCVLIILFALLISCLEWNIASTHSKKWIVVEKGLQHKEHIKAAIDSFESKGYEAHLLANDFPLLKDTTANIVINYPALAEELNKKNLDEVIVFASNKLPYYKGRRIVLASAIKWISEPVAAETFVLRAVKTTHDSVSVRTGYSESGNLHFTTARTTTTYDTLKPTSPDTLSVVIAYDPAFSFDKKIIQASLQALNSTFVTVKIKEVTASGDLHGSDKGTLVWLSAKTIPQGFDKTIYTSLSPVDPLLVRNGQRTWKLTRHVNEAIALKENLTLSLATILLPTEELEKIANKHDNRAIPDAVIWSSADQGATLSQAGIVYQPTDRYIITLFLLFMILERLLSYKRNQ